MSKEAIADAFDKEADPLQQYESTFEEMDIDIFDLYIEDIVDAKSITESRYKTICRSIDQYKGYMNDSGRHFAVPSTDHIIDFANHCYEERGNGKAATMDKLRICRDAYQYWQREAAFPHPTDYDPFSAAMERLSFENEDIQRPPPLEPSTIADILQQCTDIRGRAFIVLQLKTGIRASELCNIKLSEIHISNSDLQSYYTEMGADIDVDNAVYIPSDRKRNKSKVDRLLPLDDEVRKVLTEYLLIRPYNGEEELFLSKNSHRKLDHKAVGRQWKETFDEYDGSDEHRAITSHFGRHYFTTYFTVKRGWNKELVKYMRGDRFADSRSSDSIDSYIHNYYSDIEDRYRSEIFKLNI